jgi:hypothetical protein
LVAQVVKLSTAAQPSNNVKELAKKRSKHSDEVCIENICPDDVLIVLSLVNFTAKSLAKRIRRKETSRS